VLEHGRPKTVIEIGVFEGATTFQMAQASAGPEYKHYAIDPFYLLKTCEKELLEGCRGSIQRKSY